MPGRPQSRASMRYAPNPRPTDQESDEVQQKVYDKYPLPPQGGWESNYTIPIDGESHPNIPPAVAGAGWCSCYNGIGSGCNYCTLTRCYN